MNPFSLLGVLAILAGSSLAIEGINSATGGEFYLASIQQLVAQAPPPPDSGSVTTSPPPPTGSTDSSGSGSSVQPPPPLTDTQTSPTQTTTQPPPAGTIQPPTGTVQPPPPPPPPDHQPPPPPQNADHQQEGRQPREAFPDQERGFGSQDEQQSQEEQEEFVDPREIRQVLREIRDLRSQVRQLLASARRNAAFGEDATKLNQMLSDFTKVQSALSGGGEGASRREIIQEFRDNNYWEQLNAIRTRIQLPREIQQITSIIKRLERTVRTKAVQNLGFDIPRVQAAIAEMKQTLETVQSNLQSGDTEEATEAMRAFHENGHPGEIEGTIMRIRDIKGMLKRVRDAEIKAQVDGILQEVIDEFNQGNYRDARETLDEYADDLQRLIQQIISRGGGRSNRRDSFSKVKNLEGLVQKKLGDNTGEEKGWAKGFNPFQRGVQFPPGAFGGKQQAPSRTPAAPPASQSPTQ